MDSYLVSILVANILFLVGAYIFIKMSMSKNSERLSKIIVAQDKIGSVSGSLDNALEVIMKQLLETTNSSGAAIELVEGDEIVYRAAAGTLAAFKGYRIRYLNSLSGHCMAYQEIVNCIDTEKDNRVNHEATRKFNIRSMVVAPLLCEGEPVGVLKVSSEKVNAFDKRDVKTVEMLSTLIGPSIAMKQSFEEKMEQNKAAVMDVKPANVQNLLQDHK